MKKNTPTYCCMLLECWTLVPNTGDTLCGRKISRVEERPPTKTPSRSAPTHDDDDDDDYYREEDD